LQRIEKRIHGLTNERQLEDLMKLHQIIIGEPYGAIYVTSFSSNVDELTQWRSYCPAGQGVCIGFNTNQLASAIEKDRGRLGKVIYFDDEEGSSFDPLIDSAANGLPHQRIKLPRPIATGIDISFAAPFYKNESFASECEWRICLGRYLDLRITPTWPEFRAGNSTLIPYRQIVFGERNNDFISTILVGPSPNLTLSVRAIREFLKVEGMEHVPVSQSNVPFRYL
jgi:hypothetical protein